MTVTIQNVAKTAGVSRSTASMILAGKADRYAIDTCDRVKKAAIKLGYRPNIAARSLRHQRSFLIGAVFNQINGYFAEEYFYALQSRAISQGCAPTMLIADSPEAELDALRIMSGRRVDGLIVNPLPPAESASPVLDEIHRLRERGLPIVELYGGLCGPSVPSVKIDGYHAGYQVTRQALELGCARPMLVIQDNATPQSARNAENWFLLDFYRGSDDAVKETGVEPWHVYYETPEGWDPLATARSIIGDHKPGGIITLSGKMSTHFAFIPNIMPDLVSKNFVLCGIEQQLGQVDFRFHKAIVKHSVRESVEQASDLLFSMMAGACDVPMSVTLPPTVQVIDPLSVF